MSVVSRAKKIVEKATVRLPQRGGQGVLVAARDEPGFVITAAHCIEHYNSGGMTLNDFCLEPAQTHGGEELVLSVYAVEPVSDIAVLGMPDTQALSNDSDAFEAFCERTQPVPVSTDEPELFEAGKFPVHVLTHHGTWLEGTATLYGKNGPTLSIDDCSIESGSSGGPIITDQGQLVAIVSTGRGTAPRPHQVLPVWLWNRIAY